jgi:hypothetical protein
MRRRSPSWRRSIFTRTRSTRGRSSCSMARRGVFSAGQQGGEPGGRSARSMPRSASGRLSGIFYHAGPGDEPGRVHGDGRSSSDRSVGAAAMCAAGIGALRGLSSAGGAGCRRVGADAVARQAVSGGAVLRLTANDGRASQRRPSGQPRAGAAVDAADGPRSAGSKAEDQPPRSAAPALFLPVARPDDRPPEPGVGCRHHLHSQWPEAFSIWSS